MGWHCDYCGGPADGWSGGQGMRTMCARGCDDVRPERESAEEVDLWNATVERNNAAIRALRESPDFVPVLEDV